MKLQNQRGGRIFLEEIKKPGRDTWENRLNLPESAFYMEKSMDLLLPEPHKLATDKMTPIWVTSLRRMT